MQRKNTTLPPHRKRPKAGRRTSWEELLHHAPPRLPHTSSVNLFILHPPSSIRAPLLFTAPRLSFHSLYPLSFFPSCFDLNSNTLFHRTTKAHDGQRLGSTAILLPGRLAPLSRAGGDSRRRCRRPVRYLGHLGADRRLQLGTKRGTPPAARTRRHCRCAARRLAQGDRRVRPPVPLRACPVGGSRPPQSYDVVVYA